jgi:hypothetical protein
MQFDFGGLVTKSEEYLGKRVTRVVFLVVVLAIVAWALKLIYEVLQPILAFVASLGADAVRNPDLIQALALALAVAALIGLGWLFRRAWIRTTVTIDAVNRRAQLADKVGQKAMSDITAIRKDMDVIKEKQDAHFDLIKQIIDLVSKSAFKDHTHE